MIITNVISNRKLINQISTLMTVCNSTIFHEDRIYFYFRSFNEIELAFKVFPFLINNDTYKWILHEDNPEHIYIELTT